MVRLLLKGGANRNVRGRDGRTALMWAAISGHLEITQALLQGSADVHAKDQMGRTARVYAKERGFAEVVRLLTETEKKSAGEKKK